MIGKTVEFIVNRKVVTGIIKDKIQLWEEIRIGAPATIDYYLVEVDGLLTYHYASPKHLNRYTDEFSYRFNTRKIKDQDRFQESLKTVDGVLTYKKLTKE